MNKSLKNLVMAALFAALSCVATSIIRIPTPGTGGYIHPGDAIVILSGVFLGPVYGLFCRRYWFSTLWFHRWLFRICTYNFCYKRTHCIYSRLYFPESCANNHSKQLAVAFGGVADIILVAGGYFICELPMYGIGAAASIPSNIIQGVSGLIIASILYPLLNPALKPLLYNER